jgi:hypothetical protein
MAKDGLPSLTDIEDGGSREDDAAIRADEGVAPVLNLAKTM